MIQKISIYVLLWVVTIGYSQDKKAEVVLKEAVDYMEIQSQYTVEVSYKLFRGLTGTKVYEQYDGMMAKNEQKRYQRIANTEELMTPAHYIKLSHEDKQMYVGQLPDELDVTKLQWNVQMLLEYFELGTLEDKGSYYTIGLTAKKEMASQIAKMYLDISKDSKQLLKQTMILGYYADFSVYEASGKSNPDAARLELSYANYSKEINTELFVLNRYFTQTDQAFVPGETYKDFEVFQSR